MKKSLLICLVIMVLSLCMTFMSSCETGGSGDSAGLFESSESIESDSFESGKNSETDSESESFSESERQSEDESSSESESQTESEHFHKFKRVVSKDYLKSEATCAKKAEYYFSCECGEKSSQTFEDGETLPHTEVYDEAISPTCLTAGYTEGKHCSVCNKILDERKTIPALGHDLTIYEAQPATCTEVGYNSFEKCARCEYTTYEEIPALGHDIEEVIVIEEGKEICETEYEIAERCKRCDVICNITHYSPAPHDVGNDDWELKEAATIENCGLIVGNCSVCGKLVEQKIPEVNAEDYILSGEIGCGSAREIVATHRKFGNIQFNVFVPEKKHTFKLSDGIFEAVYDSVYTITNDDVDNGYITLFKNVMPTCAESGASASTTCIECGTPLMVFVRFEHTPRGDDESGMASAKEKHYTACGETGLTGLFRCMYCGEDVQNILPALEHRIAYEFRNIRDEEDKTVCDVYERCTVTDEYTEVVCDKKDWKKIADGVEVFREMIQEPTCVQVGKISYTFVTDDGAEIVFSEEIPKLCHGVMRGESFIEIDPTQVINYSDFVARFGEGIIYLFKNGNLSCAEIGYGYFTCDRCDKSVLISLIDNHKRPTSDKIEVVEATCEEPRILKYTCTVCGESIEEIDGSPLGHDFRYDINEDGKTVTAECKRCGCVSEVYNIEKTEEEEPTCFDGKRKIYYLVGENGEHAVVAVSVGNPVHTLYGRLAPDVDENGEEIFYLADDIHVFAFKNSTPLCSDDGGYGYYVCELCGAQICVRVRAEHTLGAEETVVKEATCEEDGEVEYICSACGKEIKCSTPALGHDMRYDVVVYDDGTVTVKENCERENCKLYGEGRTTVIGEITNGSIFTLQEDMSVNPTCSQEGARVYTFEFVDSNGETIELSAKSAIEKTEHVQEESITWTDEDGNLCEGFYCKTCGRLIKTRVISQS